MNRKKYIKYFIILVVVSLFFVCKGMGVGNILNDFGIVFAADSQTDSNHLCCGEMLASASFFSNNSFDFVISPFFNDTLFALSVILVFFWHTLYIVPRKYLFGYYVQHIRRCFGSWNIFSAIISYFKVGILHPKVY